LETGGTKIKKMGGSGTRGVVKGFTSCYCEKRKEKGSKHSDKSKEAGGKRLTVRPERGDVQQTGGSTCKGNAS